MNIKYRHEFLLKPKHLPCHQGTASEHPCAAVPETELSLLVLLLPGRIDCGEFCAGVDKGTADKFEGLVNDDNRAGKEQDEGPLVEGEGHNGEDGGQHGNVEDDEVQAERQRHRHQQPWVAPGRHLQQRVVLCTQQPYSVIIGQHPYDMDHHSRQSMQCITCIFPAESSVTLQGQREGAFSCP